MNDCKVNCLVVYVDHIDAAQIILYSMYRGRRVLVGHNDQYGQRYRVEGELKNLHSVGLCPQHTCLIENPSTEITKEDLIYALVCLHYIRHKLFPREIIDLRN